MKRFKAVAAVCALMFLLAACAENQADNSKQASESEKITLKGADISIVVGSHPSWPYDESFKFWQYFREATGANMQVSAVPNTDFPTKLALMMATPESLPDLLFIDKVSIDPYAQQGAVVAIDDYMDLMPNYTAFWDRFPEDERRAFLMQRLGYDGKTYFPQVYGQEELTNLRAWMYRKDIFEKNGLTPPETMDELFEVGMKLKELYPNSYPLCLRSGLRQIDVIGPEFKPYFGKGLYYDFDNDKWGYGAAEPTMKEIVEYFIKLREAGIVSQDFLTINTKSWEELMSTDRGFMSVEYMVRFDYFNIPNRERNPDYTWAIMKPPRGMSATGQNKAAKYNMDPTGYAVCNTGNEQRIKTAITLIDWMYSDEAAELLSWGKEGETYHVVDGRRHFIVEPGESATAKYGVLSYGLYMRIDPKAVSEAYTEEQTEMTEFAIDNNEKYLNPLTWMALKSEESIKIADIAATLGTYAEENLSKFILGQKPMSEWDAYVEEFKALGMDELVATYATAYKRIMDGAK